MFRVNMRPFLLLLIGAAIGIGATYSWHLVLNEDDDKPIVKERTPLYWVAPMDANFRRDKPGKSPMGMDLIPVYEQGSAADIYGKGAINIAPHVVNNLGVRTAKVSSGMMNDQLSTVGYVTFDQESLVHIHARVEGWVEALFVHTTGSEIVKGQALYQLYSPQLVNAQEEFLIAIKRDSQALISASKTRLKSLHLSNEFIDKLRRSRKVVPSITFYAKQSGVVEQLNIREGVFVKPSDTMMSIAPLDHVWVEAQVFERDVARVKKGLLAEVAVNYFPGQLWQGKVDYVYPELNVKNRTLRVRIRLENRDLRLKPNMYTQVTIHTSISERSLMVPKESVIRTGKQNRIVLALGEGQFKSVAVTLGHANEQYIEILKGVQEGDTVVTSAQFLIDSESSKTSDFMRMSQQESMGSGDDVVSATVNGVINHINIDTRTINISREAIEKWQRPAATMDFILDDKIDISLLSSGQKVQFTFEVSDDFIITDIKTKNSENSNEHQEAKV